MYSLQERLIEKNYLDLSPDDFIYEDTIDPDKLAEYLRVRKEVYSMRDVTSKSVAKGETLEYGLDTRILTVSKKDTLQCIGGAVIVLNIGHPDELTPIEDANFRLRDALPEYDIHNKNYAVFKSFVILPQYANWQLSDNIFRMVYNLCIKHNIDYLFTASHPSSARRNRIGLGRLKLNLEIKILDQVIMPERGTWNGYKRHLMIVDFTKHNNNSIFHHIREAG